MSAWLDGGATQEVTLYVVLSPIPSAIALGATGGRRTIEAWLLGEDLPSQQGNIAEIPTVALQPFLRSQLSPQQLSPQQLTPTPTSMFRASPSLERPAPWT